MVTTHSWEERWGTLKMVRDSGMEVCCGGILGLGESIEQRAEFAAQLAELDPHEVPLNFLNPRPGTPLGDQPVVEGKDALRAIAAFRLAMPKTILRYAGGREITLGDLGTRDGLLGGINAVIVGNYLTTLGRPATVGPGAAAGAEDAGQGAVGDAVTVPGVSATGCGEPAAEGDHAALRGGPRAGAARASARTAAAG